MPTLDLATTLTINNSLKMTYFKIIFIAVFILLEKCHVVSKQRLQEAKESMEIDLKEDNHDIRGSWLLSEVKRKAEDSDAENQLLADAKQQEAAQKGFLISFFTDSTFTEIYGDGRYRHGKYSINEKELILTDEKEKRKIYVKFGMDDNKRRSINLLDSSSDELQTLSEYTAPLDNFIEDPFHPNNNTWRLKPSVPENESQIEARVINYIQHNCYILKAATDRKQAIVSWQFSEGIIKIYNGGIGIVPESFIPASWVNIFHSKEDAMTAYHLFESYLRTNSFKGAGTGQWVKDDYDILVSIYANAKKRQVEKKGNITSDRPL